MNPISQSRASHLHLPTCVQRAASQPWDHAVITEQARSRFGAPLPSRTASTRDTCPWSIFFGNTFRALCKIFDVGTSLLDGRARRVKRLAQKNITPASNKPEVHRAKSVTAQFSCGLGLSEAGEGEEIRFNCFTGEARFPSAAFPFPCSVLLHAPLR